MKNKITISVLDSTQELDQIVFLEYFEQILFLTKKTDTQILMKLIVKHIEVDAIK